MPKNQFHILRSGDYDRMPWKNGGGLTTEIAVGPGNYTGSENFLWRVSIAEVVKNGPFSIFPGYDRIITLIEGNGMLLDAGEKSEIDLRNRFSPKWFRGDWPVAGTLVDGPVRNFNLIYDPSRIRADVSVSHTSGHSFDLPHDTQTLLIHNLADVETFIRFTPGPDLHLAAADTAIVQQPAKSQVSFHGPDTSSRVAMITLAPVLSAED